MRRRPQSNQGWHGRHWLKASRAHGGPIQDEARREQHSTRGTPPGAWQRAPPALEGFRTARDFGPLQRENSRVARRGSGLPLDAACPGRGGSELPAEGPCPTGREAGGAPGLEIPNGEREGRQLRAGALLVQPEEPVPTTERSRQEVAEGRRNLARLARVRLMIGVEERIGPPGREVSTRTKSESWQSTSGNHEAAGGAPGPAPG